MSAAQRSTSQHSSNSRKRRHDNSHEHLEEHRTADSNSGYGKSKNENNSPPLKIHHRELPLRQQQQQHNHRHRQQQHQDALSDDYDSDINDDQVPYRYKQLNGNRSTSRNNHHAPRSHSAAHQSQAGVIQSMSNSEPQLSPIIPPPLSPPPQRQEENGRRTSWDKDEPHSSQEGIKQAGIRHWKEWCRQEGFRNDKVSVRRMLEYVEVTLLPYDRVQAHQLRNSMVSSSGSTAAIISTLEAFIHPILEYGANQKQDRGNNNEDRSNNTKVSREVSKCDAQDQISHDQHPKNGATRQSTVSSREERRGEVRSGSWEEDCYTIRDDAPSRQEDRAMTDIRGSGSSSRASALNAEEQEERHREKRVSLRDNNREGDNRNSRPPHDSLEAAYQSGWEDACRRSSESQEGVRSTSREGAAGLDNSRDERQKIRRSSLRDGSDLEGGRKSGRRRSVPHNSREDHRRNSGMDQDKDNDPNDDPIDVWSGGLVGLRPSSRSGSRQVHPLESSELGTGEDHQRQQKMDRWEDQRIPRTPSRQRDRQGQRRPSRQEDQQERRVMAPSKRMTPSSPPPTPREGTTEISRPNSRACGAHDMEVDDGLENRTRRDDSDGQDYVMETDDGEPLLSCFRRRRLSRRDQPTLTAPGSSSTTSASIVPSNLPVPASTADTASSSVTVTTTSTAATTGAGEKPDIVCVSTRDSYPAFSFTLGRYKASEFVIHSNQHRGTFSDKTYPLPPAVSCKNVLDVLEAWRYGTSDCLSIQDLVDRFGLSWRAAKDRERYTFFKEIVSEFRRLVLEEGMDDDVAVKELMGRKGMWSANAILTSSSAQQADSAELLSEDEQMSGRMDERMEEQMDDVDADPDYIDRAHSKSKTADSSKELPTASSDKSSTTASTKLMAVRRQLTSASGDTQTIESGATVDVSTPAAAKRGPNKNPRPQYKDNVVEPWGDVLLNPNFIFPIPDGIESVPDMWKAWYHGWEGMPSICQLTKENGPTWRTSVKPYSKRVYEWYHCRYKIIKAIDDLVARGWVTEAAILSLEKIRGKKKLSRLHLDIPCPGHMIAPAQDDFEEQSLDGAESVVVSNKINSKPLGSDNNSNNRPSLTIELGDSVADSTTNSNKTNSIDVITSDQTTTTASDINNIFSASPTKSTSSDNSSDNSSSDSSSESSSTANKSGHGGSDTPADSKTSTVGQSPKISKTPMVDQSPKVSKKLLISKLESTVDGSIALNTTDKSITSATTNSANPIVINTTTTLNSTSVSMSKSTTENNSIPSSKNTSAATIAPINNATANIPKSIADITASLKDRTTDRIVIDVAHITTAAGIPMGSSFTYTHNGSKGTLLSSKLTKETPRGTSTQDIPVPPSSNTVPLATHSASLKEAISSNSAGGEVSKPSSNTDASGIDISKGANSGGLSRSNSMSAGRASMINGRGIGGVNTSSRPTAGSLGMARSKSAGGVNAFNGANFSSLSRSNSLNSDASNERTNVANILGAGGVRIPSIVSASSVGKPYGSITGGINMSRSKSAGGIGVNIARITNVEAINKPKAGPDHNIAVDPHKQDPRPREVMAPYLRRSRSGTEVLESGRVDRARHAASPHVNGGMQRQPMTAMAPPASLPIFKPPLSSTVRSSALLFVAHPEEERVLRQRLHPHIVQSTQYERDLWHHSGQANPHRPTVPAAHAPPPPPHPLKQQVPHHPHHHLPHPLHQPQHNLHHPQQQQQHHTYQTLQRHHHLQKQHYRHQKELHQQNIIRQQDIILQQDIIRQQDAIRQQAAHNQRQLQEQKWSRQFEHANNNPPPYPSPTSTSSRNNEMHWSATGSRSWNQARDKVIDLT